MPICQFNAAAKVLFTQTHLMTAGGPFFGSTGYNAVAGPIGSLAPLPFNGIPVDAGQHNTSGPHVSIILRTVTVQSFWSTILFQSKTDPNYNNVRFRTEDADFFATTASTSEWRFNFTPAFLDGFSYELDWPA